MKWRLARLRAKIFLKKYGFKNHFLSWRNFIRNILTRIAWLGSLQSPLSPDFIFMIFELKMNFYQTPCTNPIFYCTGTGIRDKFLRNMPILNSNGVQH